jgi:hypothetical protein
MSAGISPGVLDVFCYASQKAEAGSDLLASGFESSTDAIKLAN